MVDLEEAGTSLNTSVEIGVASKTSVQQGLKSQIQDLIGLNLILNMVLTLEAMIFGVDVFASVVLASLERLETSFPAPDSLELRADFAPIIVIVGTTTAKI